MCAPIGCASTRSRVTMNVPDDRTPPDPQALTAEEEEARQELSALLKRVKNYPKDPTVHYRIGELEARLGDWEGARKTFNKALDLDPSYAKAQFQIGLTWERSGEMYVVAKGRTVLPIQREKAINAYQKAIQINPDFADAYYRLAVLALMGEDLDMANQASAELTRIEPNTDRAIGVMKQVYEHHIHQQK